MKALERFSDIHSHSRRGPDVVTNLPYGEEIDTAPGEAWYSVGFHPWDTAGGATPDMDFLQRLAADRRVVAIGEAGIDRLRGGDTELQREVFRRQAFLAEEVGKPLIIHCVRAWDDILALRREIRPEVEWIIHGFRGGAEQASRLLAAGLMLSLGERRAPGAEAFIPADRRYCETD